MRVQGQSLSTPYVPATPYVSATPVDFVVVKTSATPIALDT